jgi:hypothetical protein
MYTVRSFAVLPGRAWLAALAAGLLLHCQARAEVHGGIEIGAKGVRAVVVEVGGGAGTAPKVLASRTQNTTLVRGLAEAGRFNPEALKDTAAAVGRFADWMRKEQQIADGRLYVVGSSGLFSALGGKAEQIRVNREALVAAVRAASGLTMDFVDVTREAELTVISVVPADQAAAAVLIDVGSGNTKGGALAGGRKVITFGIPYGTVTFFDLVKGRAAKGDFAATAAALREEVLAPALKKQLQANQGLAGRRRVYLSGGTAWAMATLLRPADRGTYVALSAADIDAFHKLLRQGPDMAPASDPAQIADAAARQQAGKEVEQVRRTFTRDQLLAGTEVWRALSAAFDFAADGRQLFFARNGHLGWILGYVTEKGRQTP